MRIAIDYEYVPHKNIFLRRALIDGRPLLNNRVHYGMQHFGILEALAATPGVVSYAMLARSIASNSAEPSRLLAVRVGELRPGLAPHQLSIDTARNLGYALRKAA